MINGTNVLRDDNPRWTCLNLLETPAGKRRGDSIRRRLAAMPDAIGARLFAANDAEARRWGWQIIKRHAGLTRRYRDPRFGKGHEDSR